MDKRFIFEVLLLFAVDTLPFGGIGGSGMGCYHGRFSFETFSHKRACVNANPGMEKLLRSVAKTREH